MHEQVCVQAHVYIPQRIGGRGNTRNLGVIQPELFVLFLFYVTMSVHLCVGAYARTHIHTRMSHIETCANRYLQSPKDCEIVLYFPEGGVTGVFELSSVVPGTRLGSARMASARNH